MAEIAMDPDVEEWRRLLVHTCRIHTAEQGGSDRFRAAFDKAKEAAPPEIHADFDGIMKVYTPANPRKAREKALKVLDPDYNNEWKNHMSKNPFLFKGIERHDGWKRYLRSHQYAQYFESEQKRFLDGLTESPIQEDHLDLRKQLVALAETLKSHVAEFKGAYEAKMEKLNEIFPEDLQKHLFAIKSQSNDRACKQAILKVLHPRAVYNSMWERIEGIERVTLSKEACKKLKLAASSTSTSAQSADPTTDSSEKSKKADGQDAGEKTTVDKQEAAQGTNETEASKSGSSPIEATYAFYGIKQEPLESESKPESTASSDAKPESTSSNEKPKSTSSDVKPKNTSSGAKSEPDSEGGAQPNEDDFLAALEALEEDPPQKKKRKRGEDGEQAEGSEVKKKKKKEHFKNQAGKTVNGVELREPAEGEYRIDKDKFETDEKGRELCTRTKIVEKDEKGRILKEDPNAKTKFKGVEWHGQSGKWRARKPSGAKEAEGNPEDFKTHLTGLFATDESAADAIKEYCDKWGITGEEKVTTERTGEHSCPFAGVTWHKTTQKWSVVAPKTNKHPEGHYLGVHPTPEDGADVRKAYVDKLAPRPGEPQENKKQSTAAAASQEVGSSQDGEEEASSSSSDSDSDSEPPAQKEAEKTPEPPAKKGGAEQLYKMLHAKIQAVDNIKQRQLEMAKIYKRLERCHSGEAPIPSITGEQAKTTLQRLKSLFGELMPRADSSAMPSSSRSVTPESASSASSNPNGAGSSDASELHQPKTPPELVEESKTSESGFMEPSHRSVRTDSMKSAVRSKPKGPRITWIDDPGVVEIHPDKPNVQVTKAGIESMRPLLDDLWYRNPGMWVVCDNCDQEYEQLMGALHPADGDERPGFSFSRAYFFCINCKPPPMMG